MTIPLSKSHDVGRHSFVGVQNTLDIVNAKFADDVQRTPLQQIDSVHMVANKCRAWYEPVFSNESKYLPVSKKTKATVEVVINPRPVQDNSWIYWVILAASGITLYKILD